MRRSCIPEGMKWKEHAQLSGGFQWLGGICFGDRLANWVALEEQDQPAIVATSHRRYCFDRNEIYVQQM
jgi:hypothetical protein